MAKSRVFGSATPITPASDSPTVPAMAETSVTSISYAADPCVDNPFPYDICPDDLYPTFPYSEERSVIKISSEKSIFVSDKFLTRVIKRQKDNPFVIELIANGDIQIGHIKQSRPIKTMIVTKEMFNTNGVSINKSDIM